MNPLDVRRAATSAPLPDAPTQEPEVEPIPVPTPATPPDPQRAPDPFEPDWPEHRPEPQPKARSSRRRQRRAVWRKPTTSDEDSPARLNLAGQTQMLLVNGTSTAQIQN